MKEAIKQLLKGKLRPSEISALKSLLAGELTAAEAYKQAICHIKASIHVPTLKSCRDSHEHRAQILMDRLEALGAHGEENTGLFGGFAGLMEEGASLLSDRAAILILSTGEHYGLSQYQLYGPASDDKTWRIIQSFLLPEQKRTLNLASWLNKLLHDEDDGGNDEI